MPETLLGRDATKAGSIVSFSRATPRKTVWMKSPAGKTSALHLATLRPRRHCATNSSCRNHIRGATISTTQIIRHYIVVKFGIQERTQKRKSHRLTSSVRWRYGNALTCQDVCNSLGTKTECRCQSICLFVEPTYGFGACLTRRFGMNVQMPVLRVIKSTRARETLQTIAEPPIRLLPCSRKSEEFTSHSSPKEQSYNIILSRTCMAP